MMQLDSAELAASLQRELRSGRVFGGGPALSEEAFALLRSQARDFGAVPMAAASRDHLAFATSH